MLFIFLLEYNFIDWSKHKVHKKQVAFINNWFILTKQVFLRHVFRLMLLLLVSFMLGTWFVSYE